MKPKENIFRRTLRMPVPASQDNVDAKLIEHMEKLELDSPHRLQEWMRNSLRNTFVQEQIVLAQSEKTAVGGEA
ncbi:hypothetical protein [Pseudomonas sp.]|uniref:hypothetical protein n=1 Tax=Pseudomonas sp. TaxID=306 RepID=UPI00290C9377|nr:hypothetical protein [Pseudomonas sp.]MDU4254445.1 hypothetical protein [Pseudomonas sp.]